jgi:predicted TPR repeat methyltransferase
MRLKKAIRLHQKGNLAGARSAYERILRRDPQQIDALLYLGVLLHQSGRHDKAIPLIRKALTINPNFLAAHQNLGNIYQETGRTRDALACYRKVIELSPADSNGYSNLCIALKHLGQLDDSIEAGLTATRLDPGNKLAWLSLANVLNRARRYMEAIESFEHALELDPAFFAAHSGLCHCTYLHESSTAEGRKEMASTRAAYQRWLEADPDNPVSRYMLAACTGDSTMTRSPEDFITVLFDEFADNFDQNLAELNYRVPRLIASLVQQIMAEPDAQFDILDAGCGTGLLAADLKPWARRLTGVDLSAGMLEKAENRRQYDSLLRADLGDFLARHGGVYDLVICADTLCYFGELDDIARLIAGALKPGGQLICSFEKKPEQMPGYRLNPHGRYSHSEAYLQTCFAVAGLTIQQIRHETLRNEGGEPVAGMLLVMRNKP